MQQLNVHYIIWYTSLAVKTCGEIIPWESEIWCWLGGVRETARLYSFAHVTTSIVAGLGV